MPSLDDLLARDVDALLADIGQAAGPTLLAPRSFREAVLTGREWLDRHVEEVRGAVCPHIGELTDRPGAANVVAALVDVLAQVEGIPAVASVAVLIYKYGITRFCDSSDTEADSEASPASERGEDATTAE